MMRVRVESATQMTVLELVYDSEFEGREGANHR